MGLEMLTAANAMQRGDFRKALGIHQKHADLDNAWHLTSYAQCHIAVGDPGDALRYAQKAVEINPTLWEAQAVLRLAQAAMHRQPVATRHVFEPDECDGLIAFFRANNPDKSQLIADEGGYVDEDQFEAREVLLRVDQLPQWAQAKLVEAMFLDYFPIECRLLEYRPGGHFGWHADSGSNLEHRQRALSVQLSDPHTYEGGALEIAHPEGHVTASRDRGTATLFDPNCLHRVCDVAQGVRYALIAWGGRLRQEVRFDALTPLHGLDGRERGYAEAMRRGDSFPLAQVYIDDERAVILEGHHRIAAMQLLGQETGWVQVCPANQEILQRYVESLTNEPSRSNF